MTAAGMRMRYLKHMSGIVNFGMATLNKFRILQATEYDHVLFLCNMDYMFEESYKEEGLFEDDAVKEGSVALMMTSMFLLRQGESDCTISAVRMRRLAWDSFRTYNMCIWQMENLQMKVYNNLATTTRN